MYEALGLEVLPHAAAKGADSGVLGAPSSAPSSALEAIELRQLVYHIPKELGLRL